MAKTLDSCGFKLTTPMGHFVGLDLIEARVDTKSEVVLVPGLAMIIHPCFDNFYGKTIMVWGETFFMTEKGPIRLNRKGDTFHVI